MRLPLIAMLTVTATTLAGPTRVVKVSPGGPIDSLEKARRKVRELKQAGDGPIRVEVAGGRYRLTAPFTLTPADSGSGATPITYIAPGGDAVFTGGVEVTGWRESAEDGKRLWAADLPQREEGQWDFRQLFLNGERRPRARHPNSGYLRIGSLPGVTPKSPRYPGQDRFVYKAGDLPRLAAPKNAEAVVLHLWVAVRMAIEDVDVDQRLIRFAHKSRRRLTDRGRPARYYVENARELLDAPGEWFLDRAAGRVFYMPKPDEKLTKCQFVAPILNELVRFRGEPERGRYIEHVALKNLHFEHADWQPARDNTCDIQAVAGAPAAVRWDGARRCRLDGCAVAHSAAYGVHLNRGCSHNVVTDCHVHDHGAGGVRVGEMGIRRQAEQTHTNTVRDCHIHNLGHQYYQGVGMWVGQSYDNVIEHNTIHDLYYSGISVGWTWGYGKSLARDNVIRFNRVYDIGKGLLSDMGGIYTLGVRGTTKITNNVFHDIAAKEYGGWGIYFDEGSTGVVAERNLVYRTTDGGFHQHYGKDNVVRDNVFAFGRDAQVRRSKIEPHRSFTFTRNVVYYDRGELLDGRWTKMNAILDRNIYWKENGEVTFNGKSLAAWRERGQGQRSRIVRPMFVNPSQGDFRVKGGSPVREMGITLGDWDRAGRRD